MLEIELSTSHRHDVNEFPKYFRFHDFQCNTNLSSFRAHRITMAPVWISIVAVFLFSKGSRFEYRLRDQLCEVFVFYHSPLKHTVTQLFSTSFPAPPFAINMPYPSAVDNQNTAMVHRKSEPVNIRDSILICIFPLCSLRCPLAEIIRKYSTLIKDIVFASSVKFSSAVMIFFLWQNIHTITVVNAQPQLFVFTLDLSLLAIQWKVNTGKMS
jgi:hypothetical protein